ncbi:transcriptional adapter 1-like [Phlebotomus argentipes]|uniref:transcriptional adapter 1-like n=1 Tax=Phlebotomus argentipes TaxID=94469 RepID=UPI002892AC33|nr:transcriptional adapter 1-like [Phlebotomus argentipes]
MEEDRVVLAKNALMEAIGENWSKYLSYMRMWFRSLITQEAFDQEARKMLTIEQMHLQNEFLSAVIRKTCGFTQSVPLRPVAVPDEKPVNFIKKKRKRSFRASERATFEPVGVSDYLPGEPMLNDYHNANHQQRFVAQELFLPDSALIMGRLLVGAWEIGLVNVEDSAAEMLCSAVQTLLKNILSSVFMKKKMFKSTSGGAFFYDVGHPVRDPFVRNTVTRQKIDDAPVDIDKEITLVNLMRNPTEDSVFLADCGEITPPKQHRVTVQDLYRALQDRNIIPSHSVYSINAERISNSLG